MELRGKTILITRAVGQSEELRAGLAGAGARVLECPAIEIVPVEDWSAVDRAASNLQTYDWLIFTSTNAVTHFMGRLSALGAVCNVPVAAIGAATAAQLEKWNLRAARIPRNFRAEGLLDEFEADLAGVRILIPRAESAREILPEELRRRGAIVDVVAVYRTVKPTTGLADFRSTLLAETIDAVVFTSPSAINFVAEAVGDDLKGLLESIPIAVIGPIAQDAAESLGLKVSMLPKKATIPSLTETILSYFSSRTENT